MQKSGKNLERLVHSLEQAWANKDFVTVESPKRFRDKRTNRLREHDVVVTINQDHHECIIAMECRDRSRPVGCPQLEGFHQKCLDTGIDKGVIVSSKGFAKTARIKAQAYGIRCLDIEEAEAFDWFLCSGMQQRKIKIEKINHSIILENDERLDLKDLEFEDRENARFDTDALIRIMNSQLNPHCKRLTESVDSEGTYPLKVDFTTPGLKAYHKPSERLVGVDKVVSKALITVSIEIIPYTLHTYSDKDLGVSITEAASMPLDTADFKGTLIFSHKENEGTKVIFQKNKHNKSGDGNSE